MSLTLDDVHTKFLGQGDIALWSFDASNFYPTEFEILKDSEEAVYNELKRVIDVALDEPGLVGCYNHVYVTHRYGDNLKNSANSVLNDPNSWVGHYSVTVRPTAIIL